MSVYTVHQVGRAVPSNSGVTTMLDKDRIRLPKKDSTTKSSMKTKVTTMTTMAICRSEVTWTTSTTCGSDGVSTHCTFRCLLIVINVMRHFSMYALWQDIFKLVMSFTHCAKISFRYVVNNDPGVDT
ncbi:hypothetical protein ACQJBY_032970 [Aegilops geniculata]